MDPKVVDISGKPLPAVPVLPEVWFAQVDHRLGRIEGMLSRLEVLVLALVCGGAGLLVLQILNVLSKGAN